MHKNRFKRLTTILITGLAVIVLALLTNAPAAGASAATVTFTFTPVADAYVDQTHPYLTYNDSALRADTSPRLYSFIRFSVSGLTGAVTKATLRLYATTNSKAGFEVHSVASTNWSENSITFRSAPLVAGPVSAMSGAVQAGNWLSIDVTSLVHGNGTGTIALIGRDRVLVSLASRESGANAPKLVVETAAAVQPTFLWAGDMETGDLTQWFSPAKTYGDFNGGGIYNSGFANATASSDFVHGGRYSAKLAITTPSDPTSGTRLFRWRESEQNPQAYYSTWLYFPQAYKPTQFWNIFQFKSKDAAGNDDPFWILNVGNRPNNGNMYLYLYYWQSGTGPTPSEVGPVSYDQSIADLPVGRWVHLEAYLKQASDFTGHLTVWQDGARIFDKDGIKTRYSDGDDQWSVNNYSNGMSPTNAVIYADDAAISTAYIP